MDQLAETFAKYHRRLNEIVNVLVRRGLPTARDNAASSIAFRPVNGVSTPKLGISRLNSPAYVYPCQRFAAPSRVANA
jgi:hypothetical protein